MQTSPLGYTAHPPPPANNQLVGHAAKHSVVNAPRCRMFLTQRRCRRVRSWLVRQVGARRRKEWAGQRGGRTVWVPNRRDELHLGRPVRIALRELEFAVEEAALAAEKHAKPLSAVFQML